VMPDELADPDYLVIGCAVDGEKVPDACTRNLIFSVPASSRSCAPCSRSGPGDVIFTSTPRASAPLASHPGSSSPARSSNPGSKASARSATEAVERRARGRQRSASACDRHHRSWPGALPAPAVCHNQPTRRKFQRRTRTARSMMTIASG
jgi:Fumarylacetoacetate (FAA) hydrolase family